MSLIKNLVKETEPKKPKKDKDTEDDDGKEVKVRPIIKSATDLQRLKLEKLMKNPDKPIIIPEQRREKDYMQSVPSFVRNVMGSSAGAGSGEFHVYRHLRRKEYARQKAIQAKSAKEQMDDDYQQKLEDNLRKAEEKTAKKRAKRLKKKQRAKRARPAANDKPKANEKETDSSDENESDNQIDTVENNDNGDSETKKIEPSNEDSGKEKLEAQAEEKIPTVESPINDNSNSADTKEELSASKSDENKPEIT